MIGKQIGNYRLIKEIARGGMGAVYLAERTDGVFAQTAAVKLIKRGMDTDEIVRRFRHERQILAALNHPNIARLFNGGTTEDGLPFFVMEYIEGEPLYEFCDRRRLSINERLKLFQQICYAVTHAHEQGIVHRDIKPGNILVTREGVPKLLDFGIAKILNPELIEESIKPTATMMRLMTPEYASPEQVRGAEISPSSDIYSLGTVLYELLTAHRPYNLANQALHEITRIICETEPEPPSRVIRQTENLLPALSAEQKTLNQIAENRNTDLAALETELSGGLDRIVLKALAKTKESRYRTVKDFSDDIERRLTGEVVLAEELDVLRRSADSDSRIATTSERSIAVLPFRLLQTGDTTEAEDKFLGLGLADALIMHLSATKRLIVRPIGSVLRYLKDEDNSFDLLAAGRELGVRFILDGFINRQGARIRVSVQLLNVEDNKTIWAGRFDEDYTNVLTLEDVISTRVAESLIPHLTVDERAVLAKRGTENVRAYEAYLRGRYHWKMFTEESFAKAIEAFNEAVAIDPDYALAYVGIADYYNWLKSFGVGPYHDFAVKAKQAGLMAIKLDPQLPEAYISLAQSSLIADLDWKRAEGYCLRALELNPYNADAHSSYAYHLFSEGQFDKGLFHARRAVEIEPQTPNNHHTEYWGLYFARRFDEAIRKAENVISNHPLYGFAYFARSWFLRFIGRHDEALAASERAIEIMGESVLTLTGHAASLAAAGKIAETEKLLEKFRSEKYYVSPYQFALIYCYLGEKEKALKALDETFEQREGFLIWFGIEPTLDILRNEPRFQNLLKSTRNPIVKSISPINKNYDDTTQAYS